LNVFSVFGNGNYQFRFIMQFIGKLRIIKRSMGLQKRAFRLHKNNRFLGYITSHFLSMIYIITANTEYFHISNMGLASDKGFANGLGILNIKILNICKNYIIAKIIKYNLFSYGELQFIILVHSLLYSRKYKALNYLHTFINFIFHYGDFLGEPPSQHIFHLHPLWKFISDSEPQPGLLVCTIQDC